MLIFSLTGSFVEIRDCTPLYADSFDLNARHLQVSFAGIRCRSQLLRRCRSQVCATNEHIPYSFYRTPVSESSDARTPLPRTPVRVSVDSRSCICRTPVPVSVRTGVGWKLYYDAYRIMCLQCVSTCVCTYVQYVSVYLRYLTQVTCVAPKFPQFFRAGFRESPRRHLQCDRTPSADSAEGFTTGLCTSDCVDSR